MGLPEPEKWFHFAFSLNGTSVSLYVNGTLVEPIGSFELDEEFVLPDQSVIFLGKKDSPGEDIKGDFHVDEFYVFPYPLYKSDLASFQ